MLLTSFGFAGHQIDQIPEVPLVVEDKIEEYKKTKDAVLCLRKLKAYADVEKVCFSSNDLFVFLYMGGSVSG